MAIIRKKIWPGYLELIESGRKKYDFRLDDFEIKEGDTIIFEEWDPKTKTASGCDYIEWVKGTTEQLDEDCPKCQAKLVLFTTAAGKKLKKCETATWDPATKTPGGCDYVEWVNGTTEKLDEDCPQCGQKLILYTTANGKRMKKCSTGGWDRAARKATGCPYVEWLKADYSEESSGEEFLPAE